MTTKKLEPREAPNLPIITHIREIRKPGLELDLSPTPLICTLLGLEPLSLEPWPGTPVPLLQTYLNPAMWLYTNGITRRDIGGTVQLILISPPSALLLHSQSEVLHLASDFLFTLLFLSDCFICDLLAPNQSLILDHFLSLLPLCRGHCKH